MAIREIKATLALDGEKKFKAGLDDMSRSIRIADTGLKAMEASYGVTGDRAQMLAKRSEVLKDELEQQKRIVVALSGAVQDASKEYGDTAKATDGYRIKLNNALKKQAEMEKAIRDTERELDELGRESVSVGREIETGIGDAAEEAAKDLRQMYDELQGDVRGIGIAAGISAAKDLGGTIVDTGQGLMDFAESSREYRRQMSFLERNAEAAGQDYAAVKELLFETAALTGEVDGAVEGISNLLAAGFDFSKLVTGIELLKGAVVQFPDTMKFESLADSMQETIATGEATGQYAELLGRLGVDVETFNKAMEEAENLEERQQVALSFLANNGLKETYTAYQDHNEALLKAEEVTLRWNDELATLGGTLDRLVATPLKGFGAMVLEEVNSTIEGIERWVKTGDPLQMFEGAGETEVPEASRMDTEEAQAYYRQLQKELEQSMPDLGSLPTRTVQSTLEAEYSEIERSIAEAEANRQRLIAEAQAAEEAARQVAESESNWLTNLWNKITGQDEQAEENRNEYLKNMGEGSVESVQEGMQSAEPAASSAAMIIGSNIAVATGNGINAEAPFAIGAAAAMVDGVNAELARLGAVGGNNLTAGLYDRVAASGSRNASASGSGRSGTTVVPLYMDSQKVGEAVIPAVSGGIGAQVKQLITIG